MVSGPHRCTCGRTTQPLPKRTAPSRTALNPISTSSASSASGDITAVGWMRAVGAIDMTASRGCRALGDDGINEASGGSQQKLESSSHLRRFNNAFSVAGFYTPERQRMPDQLDRRPTAGTWHVAAPVLIMTPASLWTTRVAATEYCHGPSPWRRQQRSQDDALRQLRPHRHQRICLCRPARDGHERPFYLCLLDRAAGDPDWEGHR